MAGQLLDTAVVLFTRDLRVRDHPALAAAARDARRIVPLFVLDDRILRSEYGRAPNRVGFLAESLADLDRSLRRLGSHLVVRSGDPVDEIAKLAPDAVYCTEDASAHAQRREALLAERFDLRLHPGTTVVGLDDLKPYRVFTPYYRVWLAQPRRAAEEAPRLRRPRVAPGKLPRPTPGGSPDVPRGGETAGRARLEEWLAGEAEQYDTASLIAPTSRLSPYLHFGCVSPLELVRRAAGADEWIRQLCWRDFYAQLLRAFPATSRADLYDRPYGRGGEGPLLDAWREGRTGYPLVDAGMRQLQREGWMHNRARLVTASFLVKDPEIDWRQGAEHFERLLVDGDVASNRGNWQWVAGTGVDRAQVGRMFNPTLQARKLDPDGAYVKKYVPELGSDAYPPPIVDHAEIARRRRTRGRSGRGR
jgi:deoxyribodipyrimidine photo-lyase